VSLASEKFLQIETQYFRIFRGTVDGQPFYFQVLNQVISYKTRQNMYLFCKVRTFQIRNEISTGDV
jgi:hypothetical protein